MKEFFGNLFGKRQKTPKPEPPANPPPRNATAVVESDLYKKGDVIGGTYEVLGTLGKGGFAVVYLVSQQGRVPRALKTFRDELLADAGTREAFHEEALLWVNLEEHAFILAADCVREFSGRLFVEMDYVAPDAEGRVNLQDHLSCGRPFNFERTVEWAIQFCLGMEHANARGVRCHRDIKPANILISQDAVKISDFGLAAAAEKAWKTDTKHSGSLVTGGPVDGFGFSILRTDGKTCCGTPGYMPPEVYRGEAADVRSDIYSFGLVLWQMATSSTSPPFMGEFRGDIEAYMRETYEQQMAGRVPSVIDPLRTVVECCLSPVPLKRYGSFGEVRNALEPIFGKLTGRAVTTPTAGEQTSAFWNNKGISIAALGRREEAIGCYDKALAFSPKETKIWSNKGTALIELGRCEDAIVCFDKALAIDPRLAGVWSNKAMCLASLGRNEEAISCYDKDLSIDPQHAGTWNNKANSLNDLGRSNDAIVCFDNALAIDRRYAEAWNGKGLTLVALGRYQEAIGCFEKALTVNPRYRIALSNKADALVELKRCEDAIVCYDSALAIDPQNAADRFRKGRLLYSIGRREDAIACYERTLTINPRYPEAWFYLGVTFWGTGTLRGGDSML